jgi:hypothetical protein
MMKNRPFDEQYCSAAMVAALHTQKISTTINARLASCPQVSELY